jgi:hypothetical protein
MMLKPNSLRARLTEAFPDEFAKDSIRLSLWVEEGTVQCNAGPDNLNFTVRYKLCAEIRGWSLPSPLLWITVIDWLRSQQPDLLNPQNSAGAIPFEVDIIDLTQVDIGFDLQLTEPVRVTRREDGGFDMVLVPEPDPLFPDADPIVPSAPILRTIWAPGQADPVQLVPEVD